MAQKIAKTFLFVGIFIAMATFIDGIKDAVRINLPRYPSYSCVIVAATLFGSNKESGYIHKLGKINWSKREYVLDSNSTIGMPFYYSWSSDFIKIPCQEEK
jgi:hypothetical protein